MISGLSFEATHLQRHLDRCEVNEAHLHVDASTCPRPGLITSAQYTCLGLGYFHLPSGWVILDGAIMRAPPDAPNSASFPPPSGDWFQVAGSPCHPITRYYLPLAILAATFISYTGALALGFVFDDHVLIVTNDSIRSWRYFPGYFTSHIWSFRYPHLLANYYRPLFLTWLRLNDALFGLRPWGWHLTSVLAHVAATYLVFRLALRLTQDGWVAGVAGLIFGLHPVHVEAVADITSIQEPLSTLFILAAILAFLRARAPGAHPGWFAASCVLTASALLSKESGMVLPLLVMGFTWIYHQADGREVTFVGSASNSFPRLRSALVSSLPYWVVMAIYVPVRVWALKGFAHIITPLPFAPEVLTIPSVLLFYLRLLVWPQGLSCYYDTPYISSGSWRGFVLPAGLLAMVVAALSYWYRRARRSAPEEAKAIAFAGLWTGLTVLPVLNFRLLPVGEIAHDRYVYLPSVGFAILVAMTLRAAMGRATQSSLRRGAVSPTPGLIRPPAAVLLGGLLLAGVMGYDTARQTLFWSDDLTLNNRAHQIAPHNVSATTSLAAAVAQRGMDGTAMALYQQALAVQPQFWRANVNLAYLYYAHGDLPKAAEYFRRACAADPSDGDQFLYLGMSLLRLGQAREAEKAVRAALLVRPQGENYHLGLGMVLKQEGKLPEASQEFKAELAGYPENAQARSLLAEVTRQMRAQGEKSFVGQGPESRP